MMRFSGSVEWLSGVVAWGISASIALLVPLVFFFGSYQYLRGVLEARTELRSRDISRIIEDNPLMWRFEEIRLSELLGRGLTEDRSEAVEIVAADGELVARNRSVSGVLRASYSHPIYDAGQVVAQIRVYYSLRPLLARTLLIALGSLVVAFLVFFALRTLPLRAVNDSARALKESEKRYRSLFESMKEGLAIHRLDPGVGGTLPALRLMDVNPSCLALLQLDRKAVLGRDSFTLFGPDFAEHRSEFQRVEEREGFAAFELTLPGRDRLYAVQAFSPAKGQIATLFEDITDRREAENERLNLERQLLQAQKLESLGILSGGIAHDFNNLLAAMQGYLNLVQVQVDAESPAFKYLESMERVVHRATDLTSQMLAYSGKGRFVVKQHSLNRVIEEMNDLMKVTIPKKILLDLDLAPLLPPVEADAAQIQQVILNLLTNAADAIGDKEGVIRITTRSLRLGPDDLVKDFPGQNLEAGVFVALEVSDSGCGMTPEVRTRIFDPFFSTKSLGRGLGLSAIQGILRGHHAGLRVDSEPGRGTTFKVHFRASALEMESSGRAAVSARKSLDGTVLLVDDEVMITDSVSAMLEGMGLKVLIAYDGRQAVEVFQRERNRINLVLMDLTMPHLDGMEAARLIHRLEPRMPVILSSGYSEHESVQRGSGDQAVGFLQKPYSLQVLYEALCGALKLPST